MYYGPTPCSEECVQTTDPDYPLKARRECGVWVGQLTRALEKEFGEVPEGLNLRIKGERHDFGTYYEVVGVFHTDDREAVDAAFWLEANAPEEWDEQAKKEINDG